MPGRARTPLTDCLLAVGDRITLTRRTGAVLAVSTGLVATVALPASAAGTPAQGSPSVAVAGPSVSAAALAAPAVGGAGVSLAAPAFAKVTFDTSVFGTEPAAKPKAAATAERTTTAASRGTERKAIKASSTAGDSGDSGDSSSSGDAGSAADSSDVISIAKKYVGTPYVYGGTTPSGFDCSGYTSYVFKQLGIKLPRTADAQMDAASRISKSSAKSGDLVFFVSGSHAYHVGIYAGDGMMYDAPKPGKSVSKRAIWDATVVYARVS